MCLDMMERKGFGGACFPKDSLALIKFANDLDIKFKFINIYS